jgi:hypothetical protein
MKWAPDLPGTPLIVKLGRDYQCLGICLNDRVQEWIKAADARQIFQG